MFIHKNNINTKIFLSVRLSVIVSQRNPIRFVSQIDRERDLGERKLFYYGGTILWTILFISSKLVEPWVKPWLEGTKIGSLFKLLT